MTVGIALAGRTYTSQVERPSQVDFGLGSLQMTEAAHIVGGLHVISFGPDCREQHLVKQRATDFGTLIIIHRDLSETKSP